MWPPVSSLFSEVSGSWDLSLRFMCPSGLSFSKKDNGGGRSDQHKLPGGTVRFPKEERGSVPREGGGLGTEQELGDQTLLSSLSLSPTPSCLP